MLALPSLLFAILIPGTVAVLIPYLIVSGAGAIPAPRTPLQLLSLVAMVAGAAILIWCIWDLASRGRGTLARRRSGDPYGPGISPSPLAEYRRGRMGSWKLRLRN